MTERRFFLPDIAETRMDDATGELVGFASVFFDPTDEGTQFTLWDDSANGGPKLVERVNKRAFNRAIRERHEIMGLFNHNMDNVLGRFPSGTMRLEVLPRGLFYRIKPSDRTIFRDVADMVRTGDVPGASFSFRVPDGGEKRYRDGDLEVRELMDIDIIDVGPTPRGAYRSASAMMRYADETSLAELRTQFSEEAKRALILAEEKRAQAEEEAKNAAIVNATAAAEKRARSLRLKEIETQIAKERQ